MRLAHLGLIFCPKVHVRVFLQLVFGVLVSAQAEEEPGGVPVSGCVWSGSRLLVLQDPNSARRDSYSKPTHRSPKPQTASTFLDECRHKLLLLFNSFYGSFYACAGGENNMSLLVLKTAQTDAAEV